MSKPSQNGRDPNSRPVDHENPIWHKDGSSFGQPPRWIHFKDRDGEITHAERKFLYWIADQTRSWGRPCVRASLSDLARGTGLSRRWVVEVRDRLVERGLVVQCQDGNSYLYGVSDPGEDPRMVRMKVQHRIQDSRE